MDAPFVYRLVDKVIESLGSVYPDIAPRREFVKQIIQGEEGRFHQTLDRGLDILGQSLDELETQQRSVVPGERAFELYDTFGFPLDLTEILARERGLSVDEKGFVEGMSTQRERSRAAWKAAGGSGKDDEIYLDILREYEKTEFLGYDAETAEAEVIALIRGDELVSGIHEGDEVSAILNRTPFYGESGGQVGDIGTIESENAKLEVVDSFKPNPNLIVHKCKVIEGEIVPQTPVTSQIDAERRGHIAVSHTATHMLHSALRKVLGMHVSQAGSLVEPGRLRFDFTHFQAVTKNQLREIEGFINDCVRLNDKVEIDSMSLQAAKSKGALAFFGDKYGDVVRVVEIGDYSMELCGGTHAHATGDIALVKIISESSIAAGTRRIEAVAGRAAYQHICSEDEILSSIGSILKTQKNRAPEQVERLVQANRELEQQIKELQTNLAKSRVVDLVNRAVVVNGFRVVASVVDNTDRDGLRRLTDELKNHIESGVVVLASVTGNEVAFTAGVTPDLVQHHDLQAGKIIQAVTRLAEGRGGGRPELAQGGSRNPSKMKCAIDAVVKIVANQEN